MFNTFELYIFPACHVHGSVNWCTHFQHTVGIKPGAVKLITEGFHIEVSVCIHSVILSKISTISYLKPKICIIL